MNYKKLFKIGELPKVRDLKGSYIVRLAPPILPPIRLAGHQKYFPDHVASQGGGFNRFLGLLKLGNFRIELGNSELSDGLTVLKIIYDHPKNPFFLRLLTDEIREIKPGHYLGRGIVNILGIKFNIFYFTVTKDPSLV